MDRHINGTATTMYLPKLYWFAGGGLKECGVGVDMDLRTLDATDMIRFSDLRRTGGCSLLSV